MTQTYVEAVAEARRADPDLVLLEHSGAHAVVTLNDPDKLNPLSAALTVRLREALADLAGDESLRLHERPGVIAIAHSPGRSM